MKFHPYSEIFPLIEGAEFDALVEDIKAQGLREKIWCYKGKVLDGRNRFLACKKAGVKATTRPFKGTDSEALSFVWSANAQRRHLNTSQLAMAAARRATLSAGSNQHAQICAPSQTKAATEAGISRRSVQTARKVIEEGSKELQRAVESGEVSVSKAAAVVELPKKEQLKAAISKPEKTQEATDLDFMPEPEPLTAEELAEMDSAVERERAEAAEKIMASDDRLSAANDEVQRLARDLANMTRHRDHWMEQAGSNARFAKGLQRKIEKLNKQLEKAEGELEKLRERISIMEAA